MLTIENTSIKIGYRKQTARIKMSIQVRIVCYLPQHHENHISVNESEVDNNYPVVDIDLDELEQFNSECVDFGTERLRVVIEVPLEYCEFEAKIYGVTGSDELLSITYTDVEIISATIPGIDTNFYDVDDNNEEATMQILKLLGSR